MREDETICDFCQEVTKAKFTDFYKLSGKVMCSDCYSELIKCTHCHDVFQEKELIEFEGKLFCDNCLELNNIAYCRVCNQFYMLIDDNDRQLMCYECRKDLEHFK